uniref:Type II secretion system protein K n=1 Tax=Candidatus Kentrum sp. SD TaxID=2126332 RepID=A0A450YHY1_9GAMM|nr:MAG: general secretion pathway protein K [Candidatus Kentron sp. SD]VFK46912.1 MAG: general secretion pathway protein K [Candidatus Kentron sp. SD]
MSRRTTRSFRFRGFRGRFASTSGAGSAFGRKPIRRDRATGIALVSVILAVALVATISAGIIARQHLEIRRVTNLLHAHQAYEYALGVEFWAAGVLRRDLLEGSEERVDHPGEAWGGSLPPTDIEGGTLTGRIEDLRARFNLNNLRQEDPENEDSDNQEAWRGDFRSFQGLLKHCELEPRLIWPVIDWIDGGARDEISPGGAEDYQYLGLDIPYRAANAPMADPSELVLVQGFDYEAYACLSPLVSALPEYAPININTASAPVLMAIITGMTQTQAKQVVDRREREPYQSVDGFLEYLETIGAPVPEGEGGFNKGSISVSSNYYLVVATTQIGNTRMDLFSRIKRLESGETRVLSRRRGSF